MPIFPLPPVRWDETEEAALKTRVRGPGQNFCMRIRAASGIVATRGITSRSLSTMTETGFLTFLPLMPKDLLHTRFLARIDTEAVEGFRREGDNAPLTDDSYSLRESLFIRFPGIDFQMDGHFRFSCFRSTSLAILRM